MKKITGTIGTGPDAPQIRLTLYTPASVKKPVPVILVVNFGGGPSPPPSAQVRGGGGFPSDPPVHAEIISRGWGYATVGYQDIQPNEMPVDAHMLIALSAPRAVFISGGTTDQWADPVGMFKAAVAAGPVYRLLGRKDLGVTELPALDTPVITGDLAWHYHTGGHTATAADWKAFLEFLSKYF